jgi:methylated-DNA-[protein]-cysteine S-methyltransferase
MASILQLSIERVQTPIGVLLLAGDEASRLRALDWTDYEERMVRLLRLHYGMHGYELAPAHNPNGLSDKMVRYFAGDPHAIDDIETATAGTPFQRRVWNELRKIPTGSVISYGTLAQKIGRSSAARAVGLANGSNPIGIVVPCHRVIGSNGTLTGYGGGLERKRWLLDHEAQNAEGSHPKESWGMAG